MVAEAWRVLEQEDCLVSPYASLLRPSTLILNLARVYKKQVDDLERRMAAGTARECFATQFLADPSTANYGKTQTYFALGSLMEAGSDTSRMTISQIIAAAATDKRWVVTAREHLDHVCGANAERLPSFDDRSDLQYITAATKESFRWRPFAEIGLPTMLIKDDEYEGYRFPAGTIFTWNSFAIAMDEREYEDPMRFWPERFLNKDLDDVRKGHWSFGPGKSYPTNVVGIERRTHAVTAANHFGALSTGRRVCSGYNVGETNVWIAMARLLYCFDFEQVPVSLTKLLSWANCGVNPGLGPSH
jgi:cytochrome P450